jgi:hypothetical protein
MNCRRKDVGASVLCPRGPSTEPNHSDFIPGVELVGTGFSGGATVPFRASALGISSGGRFEKRVSSMRNEINSFVGPKILTPMGGESWSSGPPQVTSKMGSFFLMGLV